MAKAKKRKVKAIARVPQSREDAVFAVGRIGELRRAILSCKAIADETVRLAGEKFEADIAAIALELAEHEAGVQTWCEANRLALTRDGKVKFHQFATGSVSWKALPPSVKLTNVEAVLEGCRKVGFSEFIRTKEEVNREAMLADPARARLITGVTISSEGEQFEIVPAELESSLGKA